jgi:hypothetical protein
MDKTSMYEKYITQLILHGKVIPNYMPILLTALEDKDFQTEEDKSETVDKLISTILLMDKNTISCLILSSDKLKCDIHFIKTYIATWGTCDILDFCDKSTTNEELMLLAVSIDPTNIQHFIINADTDPVVLLKLLDVNVSVYDFFPREIKTSYDTMMYVLQHSPHRTLLRVYHKLLNNNKFIFDLSKVVPPSEILKIFIKGEKTFLFAIQDKLIDTKFVSDNLSVCIESLDKEDCCIIFEIEDDGISLHSYYYSTSAAKCPYISHDDFFSILDTISSIYQYPVTLYDASKKLIKSDAEMPNPHKDKYCTLRSCIMSLAIGSTERGRRFGNDEWNGTFYSQYGFKNDLYNQFMQEHQPKLLSEYDRQLYEMLDTIIKHYGMPIDATTLTLQDCAKLIIQFCKEKPKLGVFKLFIDNFSRNIYEKISNMRKFVKPVSTQKYVLELLEHEASIVFNIKKMAGGKRHRKTKKYIKRAV